MKGQRDAESDDKIPVGEKLQKTTLFGFLPEDFRDPEQREVHLFVLDPLVGEQSDHPHHGRIDEDHEKAPPYHGQGPVGPGNLRKHLPPAHIQAALEAAVEGANHVGVFGKKGIRQERRQKLAEVARRCGEPGGGGDVDDESAHESGVGDARGHRNHGPDQQELMKMKTPVLSYERQKRIDDHQEKQEAPERSQGKMAAGKGAVLQFGIVVGREGGKKNDQDQARKERRKAYGSLFHPRFPLFAVSPPTNTMQTGVSQRSSLVGTKRRAHPTIPCHPGFTLNMSTTQPLNHQPSTSTINLNPQPQPTARRRRPAWPWDPAAATGASVCAMP